MCCFEMYFSTRKSVRRKKVSFQFFDVPFFYLAESVWRCKRDEHVDAHFSAEKRFNSIKIASIMFKLLHISCTLMWAACDLGKKPLPYIKNPHWTCVQSIMKTNNIVVRQKSILGAKTINRNWVGDSRQQQQQHKTTIGRTRKKFIENLWVFSS